MEVKINREIREYTESMFFGLSLRQFFFSVLACAVAVLAYFALKPLLGLETVSWVCILAAVPFAAIGFVKYNGMHAEAFVWAWIKSEFLLPRRLCFGETNLYLAMFKASYEEKKKKNGKVRLPRRGRRERKGKQRVGNGTCGRPISQGARGPQKHKESPAEHCSGMTPLQKRREMND